MVWFFYPYKTVVVNQQPYTVNEKIIKQGDNLNYVVDACNETDVIPKVSKQFVDGLVYSVPEGATILRKECNKTLVTMRIPKNLPPGEYYLKVFVEFEVNPIRNILKEYETEKFTVIQ